MGIEEVLTAYINNMTTVITETIQKEHPIILAAMAGELFDKHGAFNGRAAWLENSPATIKDKGSSDPNIESGQLKRQMTVPGFLENDNWLGDLKPPAFKSFSRVKNKSLKTNRFGGGEDSNRSYEYADKTRPFSDIGKTPADNEYMAKELAKELQDVLNS